MTGRTANSARAALPFRSVNRADRPGYRPGLQRHHLLPCQMLATPAFGPLFDHLGRDRIGFDDFRANGMLLPCDDDMAVRLAMPLHRGPHRQYNELVAQRIGQVEGDWSRAHRRCPDAAHVQALMRLRLLQQALRRRLLDGLRPLRLNRRDPVGHGRDFAELDQLVDHLWGASTGI